MLLLKNFQEFYQEVIRLKARVSSGEWVFETGRAESRSDGAADLSPTSVWRTLHGLLERQALAAVRSGGDFGAEHYGRAQYAMAALADEIFLHLEWAGQEAWRSHLLESRLFGSHRAGEDLFERIESLLRDRDDNQAELARVYLLVLALGFQGKFRGRPEQDRELEAYRSRLFRLVAGHEPRLQRNTERLIDQAYQGLLDDGRPSTLPHLRPWLWAIGALLAAWLGASEVLWRHETGGLRKIIGEIQELAGRQSTSGMGGAS